MSSTEVNMEWCIENIVAKFHIEKLLRLKAVIEREIVNRTMTGNHPDRNKKVITQKPTGGYKLTEGSD